MTIKNCLILKNEISKNFNKVFESGHIAVIDTTSYTEVSSNIFSIPPDGLNYDIKPNVMLGAKYLYITADKPVDLTLVPGVVNQVAEITMIGADSITSGEYFTISSGTNATAYAIWFNKDGAGADPLIPAPVVEVEVDITTGESLEITVAAVQAAIAALNTGLDFSVTRDSLSPTMTVTCLTGGVTTPPANVSVGTGTGSTGFKVSTSVLGRDVGMIASCSSQTLYPNLPTIVSAYVSYVRFVNNTDEVANIQCVMLE